jgi:hypothetical protein
MDYSIRPAGWLGYFLTATSGRKASTPVPVSRIRQTYRLSRDIASIILGWKMKNDLGHELHVGNRAGFLMRREK